MGLKVVICIAAASWLTTGCVTLPQWAQLPGSAAKVPAARAQAGQFSFDWSLSGDREVAPLQVFDDGQETWLQFTEAHPVPAIFQRSVAGADQPLAYRKQPPYVVVSGRPEHLVFRGGALIAHARHLGSVRSTVSDTGISPAQVAQSVESNVSVSMAQPNPVQVAIQPDSELMLSVPGTLVASSAPVSSLTQSVLPVSSPAQSVPLVPAISVFTVSPQDTNLRRALVRWSGVEGWTFEPEHWAVDMDIPVAASADFPYPFVEAVQALIASTELSDRPLQPCFYSNRVLRIVPYAQACDRRAAFPLETRS